MNALFEVKENQSVNEAFGISDIKCAEIRVNCLKALMFGYGYKLIAIDLAIKDETDMRTIGYILYIMGGLFYECQDWDRKAYENAYTEAKKNLELVKNNKNDNNITNRPHWKGC